MTPQTNPSIGKQTLRYHDEKYFDEYLKTDKTVEGFDYPYLCQICGKFLSKEDVNYCGDADWLVVNGVRYSWVCDRHG